MYSEVLTWSDITVVSKQLSRVITLFVSCCNRTSRSKICLLRSCCSNGPELFGGYWPPLPPDEPGNIFPRLPNESDCDELGLEFLLNCCWLEKLDAPICVVFVSPPYLLIIELNRSSIGPFSFDKMFFISLSIDLLRLLSWLWPFIEFLRFLISFSDECFGIIVDSACELNAWSFKKSDVSQ